MPRSTPRKAAPTSPGPVAPSGQTQAGHRGGAAPRAETGEQGSSTPGVWQKLRSTGVLVIGQLSAITALAFYFGWVRTQSYLKYFGLDTSLVNYTTTDYVLRSISAAYWPLMGLGAAVVVALPIHAGLFPWVRSQRPSGQTYYRGIIALTGLGMLGLAVAGLGQKVHFSPAIPVIPLLIT